MYALSEYHYRLPAELIAQKPAERRDGSRLMVMDRRSGELHHHHFYELDEYLRPGDVLVVNNSAVIPGRLVGKKDSGGRVEVLICSYNGDRRASAAKAKPVFKCLIKSAKPPRSGGLLLFDKHLSARVLERRNETYWVEFHANGDFEALLDRIGNVPLPLYIERSSESKAPCDDRAAYQTVYATERGAIAAPTAGLHFTPEVLAGLKNSGTVIAAITLHVGYGTFQPVRTPDIRHHQMHSERFSISAAAAQLINTARAAGHRVVAVGTTCVRTLEYAADSMGRVAAGTGDCDLFIYPGYRFKAVDAMITNFHLPRSTLLALVAALPGVGIRRLLDWYREAIKLQYRFYSFGDAMLIV